MRIQSLENTTAQWTLHSTQLDGVNFMASAQQATTKRLKMSERAEQQLQLHFPNWAPEWLWRRKSNDGYTTLPRTLPIVMQAVDDQSKGQPAGHTLFCLWARSPDHPFVTIENPATFAAEAGFDGVRAVDTWRRRMRRLRELNLIVNKKGPSGDFHYVLLMNPNVALELMKINNLVQTDLYARFMDRLTEVGGFRDIESARVFWVRVKEQLAAEEAKKAAAAAATVPPPPLGEATVAEVASAKESSVAATVKGPARKKSVESSASAVVSEEVGSGSVRRRRRVAGA